MLRMAKPVLGRSEAEARAALVAEARTWIGTPYHGNADVKGAGVDCGMLLVRCYVDLGLIPAFDPRPYPMQWSLHQSGERFLGLVSRVGVRVPGPPLPGDVVVWRIGKSYGHGGMVSDWPKIIHATPPGPCVEDTSERSDLARCEPIFFSLWPRA